MDINNKYNHILTKYMMYIIHIIKNSFNTVFMGQLNDIYSNHSGLYYV